MDVKEYGYKITDLCIECMNDPDTKGTDSAVLVGALEMCKFEILKRDADRNKTNLTE